MSDEVLLEAACDPHVQAEHHDRVDGATPSSPPRPFVHNASSTSPETPVWPSQVLGRQQPDVAERLEQILDDGWRRFKNLQALHESKCPAPPMSTVH